MDGRGDGSERGGGLGGAQSLFLSVYLLLLAFFIALCSLATPMGDRTQAAVSSVAKTFGARGAGVPAPSQSGPVLGSDREVTPPDVGDLFRAEIPAAHVETLTAGDVLQASFRTDALFLEGTDALRPGREAFLARLVAALTPASAAPPRAMEIVIATGGASDATMPDPTSLEVRRAATLGRLAHALGGGPGMISAGLGPGPLDTVVFTFRRRGEGGGQP